MDREKVIKALECCSRPAIRKCKECPYESYCYHDSLCDITIHDALALLKEQEAVEPKTGHWIYKKCDDMFMCSSCGKYSIRNDYPYCHWCGVKMKQKGR